MSELDPVHEALERLEWEDAKAGGDAGLAAAGDHAAHRADRRRRRDRRRGARGVRRSSSPSQRQHRPTSTPAACGPGGIFETSAKHKFVFVNHVTTNPFFVPTQVRRRGRLQAARLLVPVDRLGDSQRQRDGQRDEHRHHRRRQRHRGRADRREGVQRADRRALKAKIPVRRLQRRRAEQRSAVLHRPGPVRVRPGDGQAHRRPRAARATSRCSSRRRARPTSSRASTARRTRSRATSAIKPHVIATGAALPAELSVIDSYATGHPDTKGYFAVDAGSHAGPRPDDPEAQPALQGRQGRRLRPDADHAEAAGRRPDRLHDRPAAVPAGLPARSCSSTCTRRRSRCRASPTPTPA